MGMSNMFYPNDPRRRYQPVRMTGKDQRPTVEDFEKLAAAYRELKERHEQQVATIEQQSKQLAQQSNELAIKGEALQRQGADLKQTESELMWARAALEQTQKEMSATQEEDWRDKYAALQAETENLRKRWDQRYATQLNEARNQILLDMLPLADHLELALQHGSALNSAEGQSFVANIESTRRAFMDTLKRYGVEQMEAQDQPFDPHLHEAVGAIMTEQTPADHVAQVVRSGYRDGERVLRPARVLVSKGSG